MIQQQLKGGSAMGAVEKMGGVTALARGFVPGAIREVRASISLFLSLSLSVSLPFSLSVSFSVSRFLSRTLPPCLSLPGSPASFRSLAHAFAPPCSLLLSFDHMSALRHCVLCVCARARVRVCLRGCVREREREDERERVREMQGKMCSRERETSTHTHTRKKIDRQTTGKSVDMKE